MNDFEPLLQARVLQPTAVDASSGQGDAVAGGLVAERRIPPKLYRIGEIVSYSGMSRQTIHNYTTMGLLRESRWTDGGHRLYDESVFGRLDHIIRLRQGNKSIQEIRQSFEMNESDESLQ